ncbi:MAG TPA: NAD(P)/FAD-dependent oxidoreductase [Candidatus Angelobacter sp.]|jgi:2-polyprenyl-6-methoxyphenol hydroxylase-like FAD-dependent oxidoreductase|nr:NAD(P)/FAD-dependent oxidoreductase [Candidatus Angelobacter sp.]
MHIAIFGAGIAGLMNAIALQSHGHECALYERSRLSHDLGMGFILMPEAVARMEQLGIQLAGDCGGIPLDRYVCRDSHGKVLYQEAMPRGSRSIRRRELIRTLVDAANLHNTVHFDAELDHLEFDENGRTLAAVLNSGERITADLFVAADGAHSRIRRALFPHWSTKRARVVNVVGLVCCPTATVWAGHSFNKFHAASGGLAVGVLPVDSDHVVWFMQFDSYRFHPPGNQDVAREEWSEFVLRMAGTWAFPVPSLLATTPSCNMHVWSPLDIDLVPAFHHNNVILAGDAAHPLSPFTSQGVASAVADAVTLANVLPATNDTKLLEKAVDLYSKQRQQQCAGHLSMGRELSQRFVAPVSSRSFRLPMAT